MIETKSVEIKIGNRKYDAWTSLSILQSIDICARSFDIQSIQTTPEDALIYDSNIIIKINNTKILTGHVDILSYSNSMTDKSLNIQGRSNTSNLVDSNTLTQPRIFKDQKLSNIIRMMAIDSGIKGSVASGFGDPTISKFVINVGETYFQTLDRLAEMTQFLCTDDADGNLVFIRASNSRASDVLELGKNLKSSNVTYSSSDRFYTYDIYSQRQGNNLNHGKSTFTIGKAIDHGVSNQSRSKIILVDQMTQEDADKRAEWEKMSRAANSIKINCVVPGLHQNNGDLWVPNRIVKFIDNEAGINRDMLIVSTKYNISNSGYECEMELSIPKAYNKLVKIIKPNDGSGTSGEWRDLS